MLDIWNGFLDAMGWVLALFYGIVPNAGFAIIMLTIVVRLVLFPLTAKQAKSMIAMQRVQPEIKKLQAKYKNDRQKLNEEMMAFYKENKINPLGGCLPLLAQMPVFFALFRVLRDVQKHIPTDSQMYKDICPAVGKCSKPTLDFFGMDLAKSASSVHGLATAWPYWVLVILVVVTAFLQQRQTMRYQTTVNPQMQMIGKVMPLLFGFFSINFPAGLVLYFFTSNLWQMGQQELVYRTVGTPSGEPHGKKAKAAALEAKSREVSGDKAEAEAPPPPTAPAAGGGGLKGLFKSLQPAEPEKGQDAGRNGGRGNGGGQAKPKPAARGSSPKGQTGKSTGGQGSRSGQSSGQPRRRNNRKRKR